MSGQSLSPIQTYYDGYRFRSRLEARWAVFFNALKINYQYEPEGFRIDKGYLPDFLLPDISRYCEVKPKVPDLSERQRLLTFVNHLPFPQSLDVLVGPPTLWFGFPNYRWPRFFHNPTLFGCVEQFPPQVEESITLFNAWDDIYAKRVSYPDSKRIETPTYTNIYFLCHFAHITDNTAIARAVDSARSARFEHGEAPSLPLDRPWTPEDDLSLFDLKRGFTGLDNIATDLNRNISDVDSRIKYLKHHDMWHRYHLAHRLDTLT